jgi:hypothetical protein
MPIYRSGSRKALGSYRMTEIPSARSAQWVITITPLSADWRPARPLKSFQVTAVDASPFWAYRFRLLGTPSGRKTGCSDICHGASGRAKIEDQVDEMPTVRLVDGVHCATGMSILSPHP